MSVRIFRLFLVFLLVFGQVGGWLHAVGHYADAPVAAGPAGDGDSHDDEADGSSCLVCLSYAALAVALLATALGFDACLATLGRPESRARDLRAGRSYARSARGPPAFS